MSDRVAALDSIRRWSGRNPIRLSVPGVDEAGRQRIDVEFDRGAPVSVVASSTLEAWRVLRSRLSMRVMR